MSMVSFALLHGCRSDTTPSCTNIQMNLQRGEVVELKSLTGSNELRLLDSFDKKCVAWSCFELARGYSTLVPLFYMLLHAWDLQGASPIVHDVADCNSLHHNL